MFQEIWSEQERDGWPSIVTLTLSLHRWVIDSTHHLTKANIWPKFNKAVWMAMERPQNSRLKQVTFNCDLDLESAKLGYGFCTSSLWGKHLTKRLKKILPGVKEIWSRHQIQGSNSWPSTVTLTLSPQGWFMGSANCPTEVNIWPTFKENPSRGKGDMEPTPNSRLKLVTFNCDLDLKSAGLIYGFCKLSHWGEHLTKV